MSDFDFSWTYSSSLTHLDSIGSNAKPSPTRHRKVTKFSLEQDWEHCNRSSSKATSSITSLSDLSNNRFNARSNETLPHHEWDSDSENRYGSGDSSSLTPMSGVDRN